MDKDISIKKYVEIYLEKQAVTVAPSTLRSERSKGKNIVRWFKKQAINNVDYTVLCAFVLYLHKKYSNKTINGHLTILRAIFKAAYLDGVIERDPCVGIENLPLVKTEPHPFTRSEITKICETECKSVGEKNAVLLNILTGLRISELLALLWSDINFEKCELYVRRAIVLNIYKVPKTPSSERVVELNELAIAILRQQAKLTGKRRKRTITILQRDNKTKIKEEAHFVFINSKTDLPFLHAKQFEETFFTQFLQKANIDHRGPGQLRHTFASQALTAGISKDWIAAQLGHNGTHMIDLHYGRWIKEDAPNNAKAVSQHLQEAFGYSVPQETESIPIKATATDIKQPLIAANDNVDLLVDTLKNHPELLAEVITRVVGG